MDGAVPMVVASTGKVGCLLEGSKGTDPEPQDSRLLLILAQLSINVDTAGCSEKIPMYVFTYVQN